MDAILVLNAGSSSIKFSLFALRGDALELGFRGRVERLFNAPRFVARDGTGKMVADESWSPGTTVTHAQALEHLRRFLDTAAAPHTLVGVGHRVVHGGRHYSAPVRVDDQVLETLTTLVPLAPLHQPHNLAPIRTMLERDRTVPQIACFDTGFHRTIPPLAQRFAIPAALHDAGIQRYGFHGLSYEYIARALPALDHDAARGRTVVLHLGNGSSMCALEAGRSIATTMGFTALEGLPMGTRCGALDPGVVLYLMDERGMDARAIEHLLYHESGLLGVSGVSSDMATLLASDTPAAGLAVDLYAYRIRRELGSLAAALGGLDAVVFTAGIGENAAPIRERVCMDAVWLGVALDREANAVGGPRISQPGSRVSAWVIPTDEELMIAQHTHRLLGG
jgi:acetate kinase